MAVYRKSNARNYGRPKHMKIAFVITLQPSCDRR